MKMIKNTFSYSHGHGAIGLTCANCMYYEFNKELNQDNIKKRWCKLHKLSLNIMIGENGYVRGEWFCKKFSNKNAHEFGLIEYETIRDVLEDNILYEACQQKYLCMTSFDELEKIED